MHISHDSNSYHRSENTLSPAGSCRAVGHVAALASMGIAFFGMRMLTVVQNRVRAIAIATVALVWPMERGDET